MNGFFHTPNKTELAKMLLQKLSSDPIILKPIPVDFITQVGKQKGLTKAGLKEARHCLGTTFKNEEGKWLWMPKEENL